MNIWTDGVGGTRWEFGLIVGRRGAILNLGRWRVYFDRRTVGKSEVQK